MLHQRNIYTLMERGQLLAFIYPHTLSPLHGATPCLTRDRGIGDRCQLATQGCAASRHTKDMTPEG